MSELHQQVINKLQKDFWDTTSIEFYDERWDGKHFYLEIRSEKFIWMSRVEQSKLVYKSLDSYMKKWFIHALRMKCIIPNEI